MHFNFKNSSSKKNQLLQKILIGFIILVGTAVVCFFLPLRQDLTTSKFNFLLKESHRTFLDLRKLDTVQWDELVFWSPYTDICDYGINGYEKKANSCQVSTDDTECYLLLLNQNTLAAKIQINRLEVDFTKANLKNRISREKAIFRFTSQEDSPGVVLKTEE